LKSLGAKRITFVDDIAEGQRLFADLREGVVDFYRREKRYVSKDGRQVWAESSASAVRNAGGQLRYIVSMVDDITARKQGEEEIRQLNETLEERVRERTTELEAANTALRESERQLRLALDASSAGTWTWNVATNLSHWDEQYYLQYGLDSRQPASFEAWLGRIHPEDRERLVNQIRRLLRPRAGELWREEFRVLHPTGGLRWMAGLGRVDRDPEGRAVYFSGINLDITERKRAEEAVRNLYDVLEQRVRERTAQLESANQALGESEERFRQVAENINEVFWMTDPAKQQMLYVSPAYAQIWGRSCASLLASPRSWIEAVHPEDRAHVMEAALNKQTSGKYNEQYRIIRPDGSIRWIRDRAYPVRGEDGKAYRIVGVAEDITVRKWAEEELRLLPHRVIEAQEGERKRVARELHDGVNQILASAKMRLLKVESHLGELHPATREILSRCSQLLVEALEENRRIAHNLHPSELDELGLTTACRKLCADFASRTNLSVTCYFSRLAGRLVPVVELNLFRILQESLNNIERHAHARSVRVRITLHGPSLVLRIQDDGRGFDSKGGGARKRKWPGIGLSNMRERAASSGGLCEVVSAPKQGTTVTVRVPHKNIE
jgi:PAS domain S-box-containing protein